jgi:hypothetical protein
VPLFVRIGPDTRRDVAISASKGETLPGKGAPPGAGARKASDLPVTFRDSDIAGIGRVRRGGRLEGISSGMTAVIGDVGGCGSVTGGARGKPGRFDVASRIDLAKLHDRYVK